MPRAKGTKDTRKRAKRGNGGIYKRGNVYWYTYKGEQKSTGCTEEREARRFLADLVARTAAEEAKNGPRVKTNPKTPEEAWTSYTAQQAADAKVSASTMRQRKAAWKDFCAWLADRNVTNICAVDAAMAREYVSTKVEMPPSTLAKYVYGIGKVFALTCNGNNPFAGIKGAKVAKGDSWQYDRLSETQVETLIDAARHFGAEWYTLFLVAATTGMRLKDCVHLANRDICWERHQIRLDPAKTDKYGTTICVPMVDALYSRLDTLEKARFDKEIGDTVEAALGLAAPAENTMGYFCPSLVDLYDNHNFKFSEKVKEIFAVAGIDITQEIKRNGETFKRSFHSFRVTVASRLAESGCPVSVATKILGHSPEMFARYFREEEPMMADFMQKAMTARNIPVEYEGEED